MTIQKQSPNSKLANNFRGLVPRICLAALAALIFALSFGSTAQAKCQIKCVRNQLNTLSSRLAADEQKINQQAQQISSNAATSNNFINSYHSCVVEEPVVVYGNSNGARS